MNADDGTFDSAMYINHEALETERHSRPLRLIPALVKNSRKGKQKRFGDWDGLVAWVLTFERCLDA